MATNIPMNELKQVVYDGNDCNGLNMGDMVWRKPYTVTIPTATGVASITVTRSATESNCGQLTTPSTLTSTGAVLYGDTVSVSATAATGYNTPSVSFNSGVDNNNKVIGDVTLKVSRGSVKSYTLSYSTITGVTNQVVTRTSSPLAGAPVNAGALTNGATIYHGDVLSISAAAEEAYLAPKVVTPVTVTGSVYTSSYITAGAVKSYQLTIATIEGVATQTVKRTSSPNAGASTGTLSNGATIYYGDVLSLSATAALGYNDPEITTPVTVTKDVNTSTYIRHGGIMSLSAPVISEVDWHDENLIRFKVTNNNGVPVTALINVNSTRLDTEIAANSYEYIYYNTPTWDGAFIACQLTAGPAHSSATTYYSQCKISYPAKPTGVGSFIIYRNGTVAISNPSSEGHFWVDRFDKIYATAVAATGYNDPSISGVGTNSSDATTVNGPITIGLTAGAIKMYTVTFSVGQSGYGTVSPTSITVPYGTTISATNGDWSVLSFGSTKVTASPAATTAEYTYAFSNWTDPGTTVVQGNMNMTANFSRTKRQYKITINNPSYGTVKNGSTTLSSGAEVEYGTILTISTTAATGYTTTVSSSTGTVSGETGGTFTVDGAETITFTRTPHTYTVKFNGNGATSGTMSNQSFTYGTAQALTANAFMRTYTVTYEFNGGSGSTGVANTKAMSMFNGWATSATGTKVYDNQQSVSNLTSTNNGTVNLYANWTLGSVTLPTATRTGYNFMGWSTSSTATTGSTGTYTPTGNVTLYAIWQIKTFTVTVACNNADYGSVSQGSITSVPYGTSISTSSNVLTVGSTTVTATPASATAQYNYAFSSWTGGSGTVTSNTTITANFERSTRKYTISYPAMPTGVASFKIYHNGSTVVNNPTSAGSVSVTYGNVYASVTAAEGYNNPTISGITTNTSGEVISGNKTVTLTVGSRKTYTISFTNATYGSWSDSSLSLPHGTTWITSSNALGSTITFTKPDGTTVTNTIAKRLATVQTLKFATASYGSWNSTDDVKVLDYTYTVPTIGGSTSGTIESVKTFTASDSRSKVTFTNSLSGTSGTNSTYSGTHKWTISGTDQSGTAFSRVFTSTAHSARYYYVISRSSTATNATSNITFTPTVTRSVHSYTLTKSTITGIASHTVARTSSPDGGADTSYSLANGATIYYNDVLTISATAAGGYNNPTVTSPVTVTGNIATKDYITAGSAITSLSAPVLGTITEDNDEEGDYLFLRITNNNSVPVTAHVTWKDSNGKVSETDTISIGANTFETYYNDYWAPDSCTVEVYFTSGSITSSTTTAIYDTRTFTVTIARNNTSWGTVSAASVTNVPYGTSISTSGNQLTIGNATVTATPATDTAQYDYEFGGWSNTSGTITAARTITANFTQATRKYTISYPATPTGVASFKIYHNGSAVVNNPTSAGSIEVAYGNVYASATAATGYNAPTITGITTSTSGAVISSNLTVTLTAGSLITYTVTFTEAPKGTSSIMYEIVRPDGTGGQIDMYPGDGDDGDTVPSGTVITATVNCVQGVERGNAYGPWTITSNTTIPAPKLQFTDAPIYVNHSVTSSSITITYRNDTEVSAKINITSMDAGGNTVINKTSSYVASGATVSITASGLSANTRYIIDAGYLDDTISMAYGIKTRKDITTSSASSST